MAIVFSFFYLAEINPIDLGSFLGAKFGSAIGMNISVPENPVNKLALELKERESDLERREQDLMARELAAYKNRERYLLYGIALGIVVLFFLIAANFYLDIRRQKREQKDLQK